MAFSTFRILPFNGRIAWKLRSRPCLAVPPAESPSTRYSSHLSGSRSEQSASLPGSPPPLSTDLRCTISRVFFQVGFQGSGYSYINNAHHLVITQFCFCLSFKLRLGNFYGDYGTQSFT